MKKTMEWVRKKCWPLTKIRWAVLVTVLYIGVIGSIRYDALQLLWCGKLNELGDFLAGFFTPLAFLWLVVGYFLQKEELGLQRQEFQQMQKALGQQVEVMKEQADADRRRSMPRLRLEKEDSAPDRFLLRNSGGPARNLEIIIGTDERGGPKPPPLLDKDETYLVHIPNPLSSADLFDLDYAAQPSSEQPCRVRFTSERHDSFEQRWSIRFTAKNSHAPDIKEITDGPTQRE